MIFHITTQMEWETAKASGSYAASSLENEGFIHCSKREQILDTANNHFRGHRDLLLLCILPEKLQADLKYEDPSGKHSTNDFGLFPHVYGPINPEAVAKAVPFPCDGEGKFKLPEALDQLPESPSGDVPIPVQLKKAFRFAGWLFLVIGLLLSLSGVLALPDGGLMFALPYFFLIPGIALTVIGGFMVFLARYLKKTRDERSDVSAQMNSGDCQ